jgi:single-strand DNA-binding protein
MGSLNRVQLIGNLGKDPELRYTPDGAAVCNFTMATTEKWTPKGGQPQEHTEWHQISLWGKVAEIAAKHLIKGSPVYIEGSIRSRKYVDKQGINKGSFEIRADRMVMLGRAPEGTRSAQGAAAAEGDTETWSTNDIPF